jgi:prolyl oligopeptidase PreP (S9A serine peptidase family)
LQKIWLSGLFVVNLFNQKHKTMLNLTEDELFNSFLDDDYQAKQFQIQNKTPYRERKPKQENIIDMVALANKIFLK